MDGGSTDGTVELLERYSPWLSYWESKPDKGQSEAINKGLDRFGGDVFNWLCSDDFLHNKALLHIGEAFASNPHLACYTGDVAKFVEGTAKMGISPKLKRGSWLKTMKAFVMKQQGVFLHKSVIERIGKINPLLHYNMDMDWFLRFLFLFPEEQIEESDELLAYYRVHGQSKTGSQAERFVRESYAILGDLAAYLGKPEYERLLHQRGKIDGYEFPRQVLDGAPQEMLESFMAHSILKMALRIYEKEDFDFSQRLMRVFEPPKLGLDEQEQSWFQVLEQEVVGKSWTTYRLKRSWYWRVRKQHLLPHELHPLGYNVPTVFN
jgi:glycosyltransferase involved in cell wall biosynthesis